MEEHESKKNAQAVSFDIDRELTRAVARMQAGVLALVCGLIAGVGLFAMTAILIVEAGPNTGMHLRLLSNYFLGYSVTWGGALIGFLWAFTLGAIAGWVIGWIYNIVAGLRGPTRNGRKAA